MLKRFSNNNYNLQYETSIDQGDKQSYQYTGLHTNLRRIGYQDLDRNCL